MIRNIYFCGSIRGGRELSSAYSSIIALLKNFGNVLSEHVGDEGVLASDNNKLTDREIHDRDLEWIRESDVVVAEVTLPSLGVGYEIGRALDMGKPVLCLFQTETRFRLSAMISGVDEVRVVRYREPEELYHAMEEFLERNVAKLNP